MTGRVIWLTGLSSAGKSSIARALEAEFLRRGARVEVLDGDAIRGKFSRGLGYSREDRDENVRRAAYVARLLARHGVTVIVALISPYRAARAEARREMESAGIAFLEVYVNAPLEVCAGRDPKGLYEKARRGDLPHFTGVDDPYEEPLAPDVECRTAEQSVEESAARILRAIDTAVDAARPRRLG